MSLISNETTTSNEVVIRVTATQLIEALAQYEGVTPPDFEAGEGDVAVIKVGTIANDPYGQEQFTEVSQIAVGADPV